MLFEANTENLAKPQIFLVEQSNIFHSNTFLPSFVNIRSSKLIFPTWESWTIIDLSTKPYRVLANSNFNNIFR